MLRNLAKKKKKRGRNDNMLMLFTHFMGTSIKKQFPMLHWTVCVFNWFNDSPKLNLSEK